MTADQLLKRAAEQRLATNTRGVNLAALGGTNVGTVPELVGWKTMPEREFQQAVVDLGHSLGWDVVYFRPARVLRGGKEKYETPIGGDAKGWPDTILMRQNRLVAAELKREGGKATPEQIARLAAFNRVPGCKGFLWFPRDWPTIVKELT